MTFGITCRVQRAIGDNPRALSALTNSLLKTLSIPFSQSAVVAGSIRATSADTPTAVSSISADRTIL